MGLGENLGEGNHMNKIYYMKKILSKFKIRVIFNDNSWNEDITIL